MISRQMAKGLSCLKRVMLSREYSKGDTGSVDCSSYDMKTRKMYRAQSDTDFGFGVSKLRLGLADKHLTSGQFLTAIDG